MIDEPAEPGELGVAEADQIVPTKDERELGARCLFAHARLPWPADRGLPPARRGGAV